ncbi:hypothetical protein [Longimicrobium sp.]|uniref:hypothetical protein n=1 Tax=Longimicrobium sp. TaxID=2029185 RepID=UPI002C49C930|nr:hypothetical protein [Longimicrobium sp.]HSU15998.1 hypothetical protein [Longimicrobium sp.]
MPTRITRLSREGTRELIEEMKRPAADTPERRATLDAVREMRPMMEKAMQRKKPADKG